MFNYYNGKYWRISRFLINHISKSSDWFQGFLDENPEYENFFVEGNPKDKALQEVVRPRALPLLHSFNKKGKEVFVWTTFSEDQVDLNYKNLNHKRKLITCK